MLKITIDNEEVLSNKNFTIEEEMLNTPSVVLDNVYPKSWENDKDYTSRFYHPNDYSKCLIKDEIYTPAEPGLNEEGTNFQITADTTKLNELTSMKGQTSQSGTPTPTTPVPINVVSGRQDVNVVGKNMCNPDSNIVNIYFDESTKKFLCNANYRSIVVPVKSSTTYTISRTEGYGNDFSLATSINFPTANEYATNVNLKWSASILDSNITTGANDRYLLFYFGYATSLSTCKEWLGKTQLEVGTTATPYEAYNGNTYEINLGKNLFDKRVANLNKGVNTNTGGLYNDNSQFATDYIEITPNTSYVVNGFSSSANRVYGAFYNGAKSYLGAVSTSANVKTFTITNSEARYIRLTGLLDEIDTYQLEKGSQATTYAPYKTPIELCKIGNYQDRIFKSSGKNLCSGTELGAYNSSGEKITGTYLVNKDIIRVEPSTNYKISNNGSGIAVNVLMYDRNGTYLRVYQFSGTQSIAIPSDTYYINFWRANNIGDNVNIQLEKGTSISSYEPYGTGWFIEKNIGKVVLNGSESGWGRSGATTENSFVGALNLQTNNIITKYQTSDLWKTNRFIFGGLGRDGTFLGYNGNEQTGHNHIGFTVPSTIANTIETFKTWVSNNNIVLYYILKDTTYTEITDTELISQLESIELLEGLNNVSVVSPYLQGIINLHYNFVNEETTSNLLFCGVVKNSGNISLNPRYPHYQSLQILDFKTFLSEGETLDFVIANKTIEEAIDQIIATISPYGFIKGNVQIIGADTIIGAYSTKDKTAYDVFNYIADITQSRWTTRLIDEDTVAIDFYDPALLPQGTAIDYTQTWFRDNLIDNMTYSYGSNDYRNKQVMTSNEVYGSILQTQTIVANGYQTQFDTELKIGQITSITANGTQLTIATNEQKELGFNADIYYTPGNNYFESADLRSTGEILIVNYIAIVEGRQIITNGTEINRVATATGRKGIVARYENRNDATTSNELQLIGQSYIRYKGTPEIKLTIVSRKNLWNIGDRVQFNAPISELATEYMVKKKTINRILANPSSEEHIVYTYEMTSSFNSEQAINYFDNQRAKAKGNIGESEYITRNVDIENIANIIFYGSNVEQATITGDNTLQATLNSPIIN